MAEMKLNHARELFNKSELELYQLSRGRALTSQNAQDLQKNRVRTRDLRDKWRDLSTQQKRALQQAKGTRVVNKTERSSQKAQLFQEMLNRFEAQLEIAKTKEGDTPVRRPAKKKAVDHRQDRATVRKTLRNKKLAVSKNQTLDQATTAEAVSPESRPVMTTSPKKKKAPKRGNPVAGEETPNPGLQVSEVDQLEVQANANTQRQKESGLTTRVLGHVSGRGKRDQAARNQRKRT